MKIREYIPFRVLKVFLSNPISLPYSTFSIPNCWRNKCTHLHRKYTSDTDVPLISSKKVYSLCLNHIVYDSDPRHIPHIPCRHFYINLSLTSFLRLSLPWLFLQVLTHYLFVLSEDSFCYFIVHTKRDFGMNCL